MSNIIEMPGATGSKMRSLENRINTIELAITQLRSLMNETRMALGGNASIVAEAFKRNGTDLEAIANELAAKVEQDK